MKTRFARVGRPDFPTRVSELLPIFWRLFRVHAGRTKQGLIEKQERVTDLRGQKFQTAVSRTSAQVTTIELGKIRFAHTRIDWTHRPLRQQKRQARPLRASYGGLRPAHDARQQSVMKVSRGPFDQSFLYLKAGICFAEMYLKPLPYDCLTDLSQ